MGNGNKHKFIFDLRVWFAVGSVIVIGLLLVVRGLCTDPGIRLFTSVFAFIYLWSAFLHGVYTHIKLWRKSARAYNVMAVIADTLEAAILICLTIATINRGGIF